MAPAFEYEKYCTLFNCLKMITALLCKFLLSNFNESYKVKKASISFIAEI